MAHPFAHAMERPRSLRGDPTPRRAALVRAPMVAGLRFALPRPTLADVHVLALGGKRVRTLACGELSAGEHECGWDGFDDDGVRCPAGSYVLRLETNGHILTSRIVALS